MKTTNNLNSTNNNDILISSLIQKLYQQDIDKLNPEKQSFEKSLLMNISHEIRTPLNAIIGFSQFLNRTETDTKNKKYFLDIIKQNGYCLLGLMSNLIELSLLESGSAKIHNSKFVVHELQELLKEDINNIVLEKNKSSLDVNFFISPCNKDIIESDIDKVHTVLFNIAKNAVMYSNYGKVQIGCERIQRKKILFYVIDSGPGIKKKDQKRVFEKFTKIQENTFKEDSKGLGIGLALCKGFVELMGGEIWLDSEPGKGSTFYFTIPVKPKNENNPIIPSLN